MAVRNEEAIEELVAAVTIRAYRRVWEKMTQDAERIADQIMELGWERVRCTCCADPRDELRQQIVNILRPEVEA